jgi:hypothetical protein
MRKLTGIIVCFILLFSCNKNKKDTGNDSVNDSANDQDIYENELKTVLGTRRDRFFAS